MLDLNAAKLRLRDIENGGNISQKRFFEEYNILLSLLRQEHQYSLLTDEQLKLLADIPVDEDVLSFFGDYHVLCNGLQRGNIEKLNEIFDIDIMCFNSIQGLGRARWKEFIAFRAMLAEQLDDFLNYYHLCYDRVRFPILEPGREYTLCEKCELAFDQYIEHLTKVAKYKKVLQKHMQRIPFYLVEDAEQVAANIHQTTSSVYLWRGKYLRQLRKGGLECWPYPSFSQEFLQEVDRYASAPPRYKSLSLAAEILGCKNYETSKLPLFLRLKTVPGSRDVTSALSAYTATFDQIYLIPESEQLDSIKNYMAILCKVFKGESADVRPLSLSQVMEAIEEIDPEREYLEDIVLSLIDQNLWIEKIQREDGTYYQMEYSRLNNYQKLARIVYEKRMVSISEIEQIDQERAIDGEIINNVSAISNVSKKHFPWVCNGGQAGVYVYNAQGKSVPQMNTVIREFAEKRKLFRFEEVLDYLKSTGDYRTIKEQTVRNYILLCCQPENTDGNLFCHSDYVWDYGNYSWRSRTKRGVVNWVLTHAIQYIKETPDFKLSTKAIKQRLQGDAIKMDNSYNLANAVNFLNQFVTDEDILDKSEDDKYFILTQKGQELTDVEISKLGVRDISPEYYREVIATVQSALRSTATGEILLKEAKSLCEQAVERDLGTRFYRIIDRYLPDQIIKIHRDGDAYLKLVEEKIEYAPTMVIDTQQSDNTEISTPRLVKKQTETATVVSQPNVRNAFSWDELIKDMQVQLEFYSRWWNIDLSMEESIKKFMTFIEGLDNRRLSTLLPQCIYEFWHYKNDEFDYFHYLTELAVCYEQVLVYIYMDNTGRRLPKSGLATIVSQFSEVKDWLDHVDNSYDGFRKIYGNLNFVRNRLAHGEDWNDTLVSLIQKISSFIALYVYTVAKFLK